MLRDAVLGDGEVVGGEIDDKPSVLVAHDHVDQDGGRGRSERLRGTGPIGLAGEAGVRGECERDDDGGQELRHGHVNSAFVLS